MIEGKLYIIEKAFIKFQVLGSTKVSLLVKCRQIFASF